MKQTLDIEAMFKDYTDAQEARDTAQEALAASGAPSEELEDQLAECEGELAPLAEFFDELRHCGGEIKLGGDWYPSNFIHIDDWEDYAHELADELGAVPSDAQWPLTCIDWEQAAKELAYDYSIVTWRGEDYYYQS